MKKVISNFSIIALAIVMSVACKSPVAPSTNNVFEINIENGADYASNIDEVEFYVADSIALTLCRVPFDNGKLVLTLPQTLDGKHLINVAGDGVGIKREGITISDESANIAMLYVKFNKGGKTVKYRLYFTPNGNSSSWVDYEAGYIIYADRDVSITGVYEDNSTNEVFGYIDLNLKKGYNLIYVTEESTSGGGVATKLSTSTNIQFKWYLGEIND